MNTKRLFMIGTMAVAISLSGGAAIQAANTNVKDPSDAVAQDPQVSDKSTLLHYDCFHELMGKVSEEKLHASLYNGSTLANIAEEQGTDIQQLISLQVEQLSSQLAQRYANGLITADAYHNYKSELVEIVTKSAYGERYR